MPIPFPQYDVLEVFRLYNEGTWPAAILPAAGLAGLARVARPGRTRAAPALDGVG